MNKTVILEERASLAYESFMFWSEMAEMSVTDAMFGSLEELTEGNELHGFYIRQMKREKEIYTQCLSGVSNED